MYVVYTLYSVQCTSVHCTPDSVSRVFLMVKCIILRVSVASIVVCVVVVSDVVVSSIVMVEMVVKVETPR